MYYFTQSSIFYTLVNKLVLYFVAQIVPVLAIGSSFLFPSGPFNILLSVGVVLFFFFLRVSLLLSFHF